MDEHRFSGPQRAEPGGRFRPQKTLVNYKLQFLDFFVGPRQVLSTYSDATTNSSKIDRFLRAIFFYFFSRNKKWRETAKKREKFFLPPS
jgi:hypothetical protein